jgi:F0F1-type ATP synthase epsilon subunit
MGVFPGADGSFSLLANHESLLSQLSAGNIKIYEEDNKIIEIPINGGFLEFKQNGCTVFTNS